MALLDSVTSLKMAALVGHHLGSVLKIEIYRKNLEIANNRVKNRVELLLVVF